MKVFLKTLVLAVGQQQMKSKNFPNKFAAVQKTWSFTGREWMFQKIQLLKSDRIDESSLNIDQIKNKM